MDPKETSKPIRSARSIDAVAKRASASSPATARPPSSISKGRSSNVIDLRVPAAKDKGTSFEAEVQTAPADKPESKPKTKAEPTPVAQPAPHNTPVATGSAPKRKFWPAFGRFLLLLLVLAALLAGAYYVYITYYHT